MLEGQNIVIEFRYAEGKSRPCPKPCGRTRAAQGRCPHLGRRSLRSASAKEATKTIPIVMVINQDPVATGLVDSLARPGGNITGISRLTRELSGKRLELLTEVVPGMARVGILWDSSSGGIKNKFQGVPGRRPRFKNTIAITRGARPGA